MKLFVKLMLALLVLALLLPFTILKDDTGDTMMSFSDFKLPDFSFDMPDAKKIVPAVDGDLSGKDIFYKWYDEEGNVQFTSEPPADGIEYTIKGYDPNTNVIQAVKPIPEGDEGSAEPAQQRTRTSNQDDVGNPYSQENIEKLFNDAKNIEKLLDERLQQQNTATNQ